MSVPTPRRLARDDGVTLVEVVLTMALFLTVSGAVLGLFDSFNGAQATLESRLAARQSLRAATDQIAADVRAARSVVVSDLARAGRVLELRRDDRSGPLRFEVNAEGALSRTGDTGSRRLVTAVDASGTIFRYFDVSGRELDPRRENRIVLESCTAVVQMTIVIDLERSGTVTAQRSVALRNRDRSVPC